MQLEIGDLLNFSIRNCSIINYTAVTNRDFIGFHANALFVHLLTDVLARQFQQIMNI